MLLYTIVLSDSYESSESKLINNQRVSSEL